MTIPKEVQTLLDTLEKGGYTAYVVGGCVRDCLLGKHPKDWDVCTNATPLQVKQLFPHTMDTGLRHGTVTVRWENLSYEVTTFRTDGAYSDGRRPDQVQFIPTIDGDLARRDYTINAMAYHPTKGLTDLFGGQQDLQQGLLRTVGAPMQRFQEDGLRILRGLRFASQLDFTIDDHTAKAMTALCGCLAGLSGERLRPEIEGILTGKGAGRILRDYAHILGVVIPEILPMVGFEQKTKYHHLDVWQHTVLALESVRLWENQQLSAYDKGLVAWTLLLHDSGKPEVAFTDQQGVGHFYGHHRMSQRIALRTARRLRFSNAMTDAVCTLVLYHDMGLPLTDKGMRRWLKRLGEHLFRLLLLVKQGDGLAHAPQYALGRLGWAADMEKRLDEVLAQSPCLYRSQLAVSGKDLLALGIPAGREMGIILSAMLTAVEAGEVPNEKNTLLRLFCKKDAG